VEQKKDEKDVKNINRKKREGKGKGL